MIRFSLLGAPVHIHFSFWVAALLWGLALTAGEPHPLGILFFALACFVCILAHELGHALVGRFLLGSRVGVCISWMGGGSCMEEEKECPPRIGVPMMLAGPLSGLGLTALLFAAICLTQHGLEEGAALFLRMLRGQVPMEYSVVCPPLLLLFGVYLVQVSVWWNALNLLPIYPLDGGEVMHELMASTHVAHSISLAATCLLSLAFFALGVWALALLMLLLAYYNYRCILVHTE